MFQTGRNINKKSYKRGDFLSAFLFLSPTLVIFTTFILFPVFFSFYLSFHSWNMFSGATTFIGLENYTRMFQSSEFWQVLGNTAVYTIGTIPINMALSLWVAHILNKKLVGRKLKMPIWKQ